MAQLAGVAAAFASLAALPPAQGPILLIPLHAGVHDRMVGLALASGARILAPARLRFALSVYGERARLAWPMLRVGVLAVASVQPCGDRAS